MGRIIEPVGASEAVDQTRALRAGGDGHESPCVVHLEEHAGKKRSLRVSLEGLPSQRLHHGPVHLRLPDLVPVKLCLYQFFNPVVHCCSKFRGWYQ